MKQRIARVLFAMAMVAVVPSAVVHAAQQGGMEQLFLQKAAEGQQAEIALAQLALQKASNNEVKQFGAQMSQDHQRANQQLAQLASKPGLSLPTQLSEKHQQKQAQLSQLSGKEFDQAYIRYMLGDHAQDLHEFEQNAQAIQNQEVKGWASATLPVLKDHLKHAEMVASAVGVSTESAQ